MRAIANQNRYTVITGHTELPKHSRFTVRRGPVKNGQLVLAQAGKYLVIGRYFADVEGCDWLMQPSRLIRISNPADVRIIGAVVV